MNFQTLLSKYMKLVVMNEGTDFVSGTREGDAGLTKEELTELKILSEDNSPKPKFWPEERT